MAINQPPLNDPIGVITDDRIGAGDDRLYGADVAPSGPQQDMWAFDPIAGVFPPQERDASPAQFTGGMGGAGLGGSAEPFPPEGSGPDGTLYQRRGF